MAEIGLVTLTLKTGNETVLSISGPQSRDVPYFCCVISDAQCVWMHKQIKQEIYKQVKCRENGQNIRSSFYCNGLASMPEWLSNNIHSKVWDEIINPFPNSAV